MIERRLRWPRSGGTPIETVGATAHYDRGTGKFTIHANTSMYNYVGWLIAVSLKVDPHRLNIVPTDGRRQLRLQAFLPQGSARWPARSRAPRGRPVKYLEDRIDNMTSGDAHGSDRLYDARLALKRDGTMLSMRLKVGRRTTAPTFQYGVGQHGNAMAQVTGPYKINSVEVDLTAVLTNKCQQGAYRGFGSEVGNFVIERLVDAACEELGIDPIEMRRRNLIEQDQFPYIIADRQHVRQRQLPGRARRGARHDRHRGLAQEAGRRARAGPLHRHRHLHLPGAERLQRHRVLDVEPQRDPGLHALLIAREASPSTSTPPARPSSR